MRDGTTAPQSTQLIFKRKLRRGLVLFFVGLFPVGYVAYTSIVSLDGERVLLTETYAHAQT